jgi:hypothetical protein
VSASASPTAAAASPPAARGLFWAGCSLLLLAMLARVVNLDADAYFSDWIGYVTDEGRWVETARNLALFGEAQLYGLSRLHLMLSPGFQVVELALFKSFGVSLATARVFSAASSVALLLGWLLLARSLSRPAWLLGAAVLGLDTTLFSLSRVALPEMPSLLFSQAAFLVLLFGQGRVRRAALAGVLLLIAVAMKVTTAFMVPAFVAVVLGASWQLPWRTRRHAVLALLAPFLICLVIALVGLALFVGADLHEVRTVIDQLSGFVRPVDAYGLFDRLVKAEPGTPLALLLAAWCTSWIWLFRERWRDTTTGRLYLLSGLWAAGWLLVWGAMAYVPRRYMVHLSLPLLMHVLAGLSVLAAVGPHELVRRFGDAAARKPLANALWLTLPSGYLLSMALLNGAQALGWLGDRLSVRALTFVVIIALLAWVFARRLERPAWVLGAALLPPALAACWAAAELLMALLVWHPSEAFENSWAYGAYLLAAALLAATLARAMWRGQTLRTHAAAAMTLACVALLAQQWPLWLHPTHRLRECSQRMAEQLPVSPPLRIRSAKASTVFLETRLKYSDQWTRDSTPDIIVQYFPDAERFQPPGADYMPLLRCPLVVHPRYRIAIDRPIEAVVYAHVGVAPALSAHPNGR